MPQTMLKRAEAALTSLICPREVRTNRDTGLIRLIAFVTMFIDHAGKMLFPQLPVMRLIGRLAFPLFAYSIAVGAVYTRDGVKYLSRVVALALISQPLYAIALAHENAAMYAIPFAQNPVGAAVNFYLSSWQTPSILLPLSLALGILLCLRHGKFILALGLYVLCERFSASFDYGIGGIRLMLLFYFFLEHPPLCLLATGGYMIWWALQGSGYMFFGINFGMRIYSLPAIVLCCIPMQRRVKLPRALVYGFYPAHLLAIMLLGQVM